MNSPKCNRITIYLWRRMTRERCSEGWAVDKLRMVNQIEPKHLKWTPKITGMIDGDIHDKTVIGPYEHGVLTIAFLRHRPFYTFQTLLQS